MVGECVCARERGRQGESDRAEQRERERETTLLSGIRREFCPVPVFPSLLQGIFVSSL